MTRPRCHTPRVTSTLPSLARIQRALLDWHVRDGMHAPWRESGDPYEALLATGFIFTIHFFNTHLRPEKFPMDIVVFTGRMSVEEFKHDKPEEYDALVASGELEKHLVEPYQPIVIRTIRAFAWTALTLGFLMIVWIVYAMVFAYR